MTNPITLRVLFKHEDGWWVARGIEHDIAACALNIRDLPFEFERVLMAHVFLDLERGEEPLSSVPPAPKSAVDQWDAGVRIVPDFPQGFSSKRTTSQAPQIEKEARVA